VRRVEAAPGRVVGQEQRCLDRAPADLLTQEADAGDGNCLVLRPGVGGRQLRAVEGLLELRDDHLTPE
jgi:hypothetical protein